MSGKKSKKELTKEVTSEVETDVELDMDPESEEELETEAKTTAATSKAVVKKDSKKDVKKDAKAKKPGFFEQVGRWFRNIRGEMKRVVWPSKKQVLNNTGIVLAFMLLSAVVVGGFDTLLSTLIKLFFGS